MPVTALPNCCALNSKPNLSQLKQSLRRMTIHTIEGQPLMSNKMKKLRVLILCTVNSARSQMAEGLLRHEGDGNFEVYSAGTKASSVRPEAIQAMQEIGLDISGHRSKNVDEFIGQEFDYVI